jgi:subtilase family serine protease
LKKSRLRRGCVALAAAAVACLAWVAAASAGSGDWNYVVNPPTVQGPAITSLAPGAVSQGCLFASRGFTCYGPYELGKAYNFPTTLDGSGQTILIVDAFGDPTIQSDLAAFDRYFAIPAPPSFTIYQGSSTQQAGTLHDVSGWQVETALDVEYAHAMAPGANIVLALASTSSGNAINSLESQILPQYPGAIVSQSFGIAESYINGGGNNIQEQQADANYREAVSLGDTVLAAAGDYGAVDGTSVSSANFPASDPWVTGVAGTEGKPYPGGLYNPKTQSYGGEQVWNEPGFGVATGGAPSVIFGTPSWQSGLTSFGTRTVPDVSYNAPINGGVEVFASPYIWLVGGTSAGTPQWASIFALANQARGLQGKPELGFVNPALYALAQSRAYSSDFHDITVGNDTLAGTSIGYSAGRGYDVASGWGTPNVANLVAGLSN